MLNLHKLFVYNIRTASTVRYILTIILIGFTQFSEAQYQRDPTRHFRKHWFWGISFSGTYAKMKLVPDKNFFNNNDSVKSVQAVGQPGAGFGGSVAYKFGRDRNWELKLNPTLQLHNRNIEYTFNRGTVTKKTIKIESICTDVPINLKYYSDRPMNSQFYVLTGFRWSYDYQSYENTTIGPIKPLVALKKNTFYYEYGIGFQFVLDFVDLGIELKMSNGIGNGMAGRVPDSIYSGSIKSFSPRLFSLSLIAQD